MGIQKTSYRVCCDQCGKWMTGLAAGVTEDLLEARLFSTSTEASRVARNHAWDVTPGQMTCPDCQLRRGAVREEYEAIKEAMNRLEVLGEDLQPSTAGVRIDGKSYRIVYRLSDGWEVNE